MIPAIRAIPAEFLEYIFKVEGGYSNHKADTGGPTNMGITAATLEEARRKGFPDLPEHPRDLSRKEAAGIYEALYYLPARCETLPWPLSVVHFDGAVHCGISRETILLQRMLNRFPLAEKALAEDGILGPRTLERITLFGEALKDAWHFGALNLMFERIRFYRSLAGKSTAYRGFLPGWLRRLEVLQDVVIR